MDSSQFYEKMIRKPLQQSLSCSSNRSQHKVTFYIEIILDLYVYLGDGVLEWEPMYLDMSDSTILDLTNGC